MMKIYYDNDADLAPLKGKKIAVIGYGSQGHAHAQQLRDSGMKSSSGCARAAARGRRPRRPGFTVMEPAEAAKAADVVMMLVPDELGARALPERNRARHDATASTWRSAHGFNIHFKRHRAAARA